MATIRKRNGKYQVQVRRKGFPPASRSFHKRADADEWARHMESQADRGEMPAPVKDLGKYTVKSILERYRDEISFKKRSFYSEKYVLAGLIKQPFAKLSLAELTVARICEYRDLRLKAVKPGTVRRDLALLKQAFDVAINEWDVPYRINPLTKISRVKPQKGRHRRLSEDEYATLQAAWSAKTSPLVGSIVRFAIATAMRRGEILSIKWTDIDWKARTLHIPVTKNGHERTIPLSTSAIELLQERQTYNTCKTHPFPMTGNGLQQAWERLCIAAQIDDLHFHDLRHEAISRFFERGLSVPEVALISGHRDYRMLLRYTHLKAEDVALKLS